MGTHPHASNLCIHLPCSCFWWWNSTCGLILTCFLNFIRLKQHLDVQLCLLTCNHELQENIPIGASTGAWIWFISALWYQQAWVLHQRPFHLSPSTIALICTTESTEDSTPIVQCQFEVFWHIHIQYVHFHIAPFHHMNNDTASIHALLLTVQNNGFLERIQLKWIV